MRAQHDHPRSLSLLPQITSPTALHAAEWDVLVCVQSARLARALLDLLQQAGYCVQALASVDDLQATLLATPPAVLLLDLSTLRAAGAASALAGTAALAPSAYRVPARSGCRGRAGGRNHHA